MLVINHQAIQNTWTTPEQILNPQTLILGSFNPYNSIGNTVDYYYGRKSNYLWRRIAVIMGYDEEYFFDNIHGHERKHEVMKNRFCFYDIINRINVKGQDIQFVSKYVNENIFNNFFDSKIFVTKVKESQVSLQREYNRNIITTLETTSTINKVIHTIGNNRIVTPLDVSPKEKKLGIDGLGGFMAAIKQKCDERGIQFITQSYSPSGYAVRNGSTNIEDLDKWLEKHLNLR